VVSIVDPTFVGIIALQTIGTLSPAVAGAVLLWYMKKKERRGHG